MEINWENICKLKYNKELNKWYSKSSIGYIYMDSCNQCGEPYLTQANRIGNFCNKSCSHKNKNNPNYGKKHSEITRKKISKSLKGKNHPFYGKKFSEKHKENLSKSLKNRIHGNYKGGYASKNIPLYDTYAHQISYAEEVRRFPEDKNILEVRCSKCKEWYIPKRDDVYSRIRSLNGKLEGECRLYCSDRCKKECSIFGKINYQVGHPKLDIDRQYQAEWSQIVKENANYECEKCGSIENLEAHHIFPVKTHPHLQADIDNGICFCKDCHMEYGHKDECSIVHLRSLVC